MKVTDLGVGYASRWGGHPLLLCAKLQNLLDKDYRQGGSHPIQPGTPSDLLPVDAMDAAMTHPTSSRLRHLLAWALPVVLATGAWLWWRGSPGEAPAAAAERRTPVRIATAAREELAVRIKALGTVTPLHTVTIRSRVDGELQRLAFEEGQQVVAGQLLAQIDPRAYQVALAEAEATQRQNRAELDNARHQLQRYRDLHSEHYVSAQELADQQSKVAQFEARLQVDQAAVDAARLQLDYTRITAPVAGRMGLRAIDVGNLVRDDDSDGIATLTQVAPISVLFTIAEADVASVLDALRTQPQLTVEAWDREERRHLADGTLASVDNRIDTATGTLRLRAVFANADQALFPNQFVNARLRVASRDAVVIPHAAVQYGSKGTYVYVVDADGVSSVRPVALGPADGERVAVSEGLAAGERVVLEGIDGLRDAAKVEIVAEAGAQSEA